MPKKSPHPAKLWTIRMPPDLLERLQQGAAKYGLPTQTFSKLIIEMGLLLEQSEGLMVIGTDADVDAAMRHNRQAVLEAKKVVKNTERRVRRHQAEEEPDEVTVEEHDTDADLTASSRVVAVASVTKSAADSIEDDILADAGVAPLKVQPPPRSEDDELSDILGQL